MAKRARSQTWWFRTIVVVGIAATAITAPIGTAHAHPFGDPASAVVTVPSADTVRVQWAAGMADDYTYLAQSLDLLSAERTTLDGVVASEPGDIAVLEKSTQLPHYALRHLRVTNRGRACRGEVRSVAALATRGITVDFGCPDRVERPTIEIAMLSDLSVYYATRASGPGEEAQAYNGLQTSLTWAFTADTPGAADPASRVDAVDPGDARGSLSQHSLAAALGLATFVALGTAGVLARRYRRRRGMAATSSSSPPLP